MQVESLNANQAADRLGLHHQTIRGWIRSGRLTAVKRGRELLIPLHEVEREGEAMRLAVSRASEAHEWAEVMESWLAQNRVNAARQAKEACEGFLAALDSGDATDATDALCAAVDELRRVQALHASLPEIRKEARRLALEADRAMDREAERQKARAARMRRK